MKDHKLTKLSSKELSLVNGGQIYAAWDEYEQKCCYLVPSASENVPYFLYYNETEAKRNSGHLPRNNIEKCATLDKAILFAKSDCAYYHILSYYQD